ncbi:MAG: ABC transporter permease subunit [Anaerolineae bacterium]
MFWQLFVIENRKLIKRPMLWIELGALTVIVTMLFCLLYVAIRQSATQQTPETMAAIKASLSWPQGLQQALGMVAGNGLGGLLVIILVGAVTAQEYTWRTLHLMVSRGVPRTTLLSAKFAATLMPALLIVLVALFSGGLVTGLLSLNLNGSLHADQVHWGQLLLAVLRNTYTLLPYAGLAFMLAIATHSVAATIGIALAYALLIEGILVSLVLQFGGAVSKVLVYLPSSLATGLLRLNQVSLSIGINTDNSMMPKMPWLEPVPAAIGIAVWALIFFAVALLIFRRQDLTD